VFEVTSPTPCPSARGGGAKVQIPDILPEGEGFTCFLINSLQLQEKYCTKFVLSKTASVPHLLAPGKTGLENREEELPHEEV